MRFCLHPHTAVLCGTTYPITTTERRLAPSPFPLELVWTTLAVEAETDLVDLIYRVVCRVEAVTLLAELRMTAVFK